MMRFWKLSSNRNEWGKKSLNRQFFTFGFEYVAKYTHFLCIMATLDANKNFFKKHCIACQDLGG